MTRSSFVTIAALLLSGCGSGGVVNVSRVVDPGSEPRAHGSAGAASEGSASRSDPYGADRTIYFEDVGVFDQKPFEIRGFGFLSSQAEATDAFGLRYQGALRPTRALIAPLDEGVLYVQAGRGEASELVQARQGDLSTLKLRELPSGAVALASDPKASHVCWISANGKAVAYSAAAGREAALPLEGASPTRIQALASIGEYWVETSGGETERFSFSKGARLGVIPGTSARLGPGGEEIVALESRDSGPRALVISRRRGSARSISLGVARADDIAWVSKGLLSFRALTQTGTHEIRALDLKSHRQKTLVQLGTSYDEGLGATCPVPVNGNVYFSDWSDGRLSIYRVDPAAEKPAPRIFAATWDLDQGYACPTAVEGP